MIVIQNAHPQKTSYNSKIRKQTIQLTTGQINILPNKRNKNMKIWSILYVICELQTKAMRYH